MRPIMFSRVFPKYHHKAGQPTYFVEKIWKSLWELSSFQGMSAYEARYNEAFPVVYAPEENIHFHQPKYHTIRSGNRWKVGDLFSPRVWSGIAYRSPQIEFAPPPKIERIWKIRIEPGRYWINGNPFFDVFTLAKNDGLLFNDFANWFALKPGKSFEGQIICWNPEIEYDPIKNIGDRLVPDCYGPPV